MQSISSQIHKVIYIKIAKWCGKTTTGAQKAKSILRMQDPDARDGYLMTANTKPSLLLIGENPRLIDEWQDAPVIWDAVRTAVDNRQEAGLFILTGSTSVDIDVLRSLKEGDSYCVQARARLYTNRQPPAKRRIFLRCSPFGISSNL